MTEAKTLDEAKTWFSSNPDQSLLCINTAGVSKTCKTLEEAEELFSGKLDFGNT